MGELEVRLKLVTWDPQLTGDWDQRARAAGWRAREVGPFRGVLTVDYPSGKLWYMYTPHTHT